MGVRHRYLGRQVYEVHSRYQGCMVLRYPVRGVWYLGTLVLRPWFHGTLIGCVRMVLGYPYPNCVCAYGISGPWFYGTTLRSSDSIGILDSSDFIGTWQETKIAVRTFLRIVRYFG